jgi:hypothetical protein
MPKAELVLAAWRLDQPGFGLAGHAGRYPDSNRVIMEVVKMTTRGLLHRPRESHYAVTARGRARLAQLTAGAA